MNIQSIYITNAIGFILLAFLLVSRYITRTKGGIGNRLYGAMIKIAMLACVVEPLTFGIDGMAGAVYYWINLLGNTYLYMANAFGAFLFCVYVEYSLYQDSSRLKKIYNKFYFVALTIIVLLVINIFAGFFFYVDENYVYHRRPLVALLYIYIVFCAILCLVTVYRHRRNNKKEAFFPIWMYLSPIVAASIVQMLCYGVSLAWIGTAIGLVALHMSLQNQRSYLDPLTGLHNRLYLEHVFITLEKDLKNTYYGIMLDINYFKQINDEFGHAEGDIALKKLADIIKISTRSGGTAFRYAGDEFVVILKADDEKQVFVVEERIKEKIAAFNNNDEQNFNLYVAMGHDKFINGKDNEDSFMKKIDNAMYANKKELHALSYAQAVLKNKSKDIG